ncbi:MAG: hypothetical protein LBG58_16645 [Planctomycetaceae bacterium]|nr:hypothetical protein [Planctomycetaceae bacterium]
MFYWRQTSESRLQSRNWKVAIRNDKQGSLTPLGISVAVASSLPKTVHGNGMLPLLYFPKNRKFKQRLPLKSNKTTFCHMTIVFGHVTISNNLNLPNVNGVGLPRVVRLNPKTQGKPRR